MTIELSLLTWTLVLAIVQIMLPSLLRTRETGPVYNMGPRDQPGPPVGALTARLQRAEKNLFETLPLFVAAVIIVHVAGREGPTTAWGAGLYLGARVLYVPLYALGVPGLRTAAWLVSVVGLGMVIAAALR
jgi:uncharacterized MAPEG superfamily protein